MDTLLKVIGDEGNTRLMAERFMLLSKATGEAIWDWDLQTNKIWGNESFRKIYCIGHSDPISYDQLISRIHPEDLDSLLASFELSLSKKEIYFFYEFRLKMDDDAFRFVKNRSYIQYTTTGEPFRVVGAMQDITIQKNSETQVLFEKDLSDSIINALPGIFYLHNKHGKFYRWNKNFEQVTGYSPDEISDLHPFELIPKSNLESVKDKLNSIFKTHDDILEGNFVTKYDKEIYYYVTRKVIQYEGEECVMGVGWDVAEKVKAQQQLLTEKDLSDTIINSLAGIFYIFNQQGKFYRWNKNFEKVSGYSPEEIEKMSPLDFFPDEEKAHIVQKILSVFVTGEANVEANVLTKAGDKLFYYLNGRAVTYNGEVCVTGIGLDLSEIVKARQQIIVEKDLSDTIINSLPGIFFLFNTERKLLRWNKNFELVSGFSADEIKEMHPIDFFLDSERELISQKIHNVFVNGEDNVEAHFKTKYHANILHYFTGKAILYEGEKCLMGIGLDLSEKVKSQQQLVESEEKFKSLIEQASDGIFISNQLGEYLVINTSAANITGYTKEELFKMNLREILFEKNMTPSSFAFKELLKGQTVISEKIIRHKSGNLVEVEISSKLLPDGRFQAIIRDITSRKLAEEGLRYSEEKRRLIMNASLDAIILIDTTSCVTFWNPPATLIFGWSAEEAIGKKLSSLIIPERFRAMHEAGMEHYRTTGKGNLFNKVVELFAINKDGREFPIELTVLPIKQGDEEFFCSFIRDISFRKNAEEHIKLSEYKYRLLFEQNPMPMWIIALPSMKFLSVNDAATLFYGFSKEAFLNINMTEKSGKNVQKKSAIISGNPQSLTTTGVWKHKTKEGKQLVVNVIAHNIIFQGENARLVLANDITDKIIAEEKLKTSHAELRELATHLQNIRESERTHMAREIHDELGQQLTGLKLDISWINKKIPAADKEVKRKMQETLKLIDGTVNTVRRLATQLRPSILDDLGVVAAMEWQSEEFKKRSEIDTEFKSSISDVQIPAELATGLFRIYQESLTNILRHSNATKVSASLTIQNEQLIFTIQDNGVGFNTGEINIKKTHGLLGMNERTKIMGGIYTISSSPGKGTSVIISVPIESKSSIS